MGLDEEYAELERQKTELTMRDLAHINAALVREEKYWRTTRRKLRLSERALTVSAISATRDKIVAMRSAMEKELADKVAAASPNGKHDHGPTAPCHIVCPGRE